MIFQLKLQQGRFLKRYKRFFADVKLDETGEIVVAHVPNTGSLKTCSEIGSACWVSLANNPERKLKYTLEMIQSVSGAWVGVNTSWPNLLIHNAFKEGRISSSFQFDHIQREVKINKETRLDLCLSRENSLSNSLPNSHSNSQSNLQSSLGPNLLSSDTVGDVSRKHYIEIKNVTLAVGDLQNQKGLALFPDAETTRGQKHLRELMQLKEQGYSCEIIFVVQREDCEAFSPADEIDPEYGRLLREAQKKGVFISPYKVKVSPFGLELRPEKLKLLL